jgi:RNA polymerase sigma-70 factor (ECF subfamily)
MRAFAISLTGRPEYADDLVQDTIVKAWSQFESFTPGTNLKAWLFTILRNEYFSQLRKTKREVEDPDGFHAGQLVDSPNQHGVMDLDDFRQALDKLPADQREAIILVGASGFTYDEAAVICGVAPGTLKSRVSRARAAIAELLGMTDAAEIGRS